LKLGNSCVTGAANWVYWRCSRGSTGEGSFLLVAGAFGPCKLGLLQSAVAVVLEGQVRCEGRAAAVYTPQGMGLEDLWKISGAKSELSMGRSLASIDAANLVYCSGCRGSTGGASSLYLNRRSPMTVDRWYLCTRVSGWMERFFVGAIGRST